MVDRIRATDIIDFILTDRITIDIWGEIKQKYLF